MDVRFLLDKPWLHHHEHITGLREGQCILLGLLLGFTVAMGPLAGLPLPCLSLVIAGQVFFRRIHVVMQR